MNKQAPGHENADSVQTMFFFDRERDSHGPISLKIVVVVGDQPLL